MHSLLSPAPAFSWRVTKYDPRVRDADGRYTRDEWIGAAQIGETFADGVLTEERCSALDGHPVRLRPRALRAAPLTPLSVHAVGGSPL